MRRSRWLPPLLASARDRNCPAPKLLGGLSEFVAWRTPFQLVFKGSPNEAEKNPQGLRERFRSQARVPDTRHPVPASGRGAFPPSVCLL